ncbi:hypothetical protein [Rariglobus hedericola]|uniref:Proteinase inhibitor I42 chagasin domain-containing protein n=1 Tax=Rariglobus hedericola TaxID=2597822 RepID=A0A556QPP2_9BACT|nr:hypothetical protein [Rariglobus hedericola]TSJ78613.1 hypothetical protein FPL22_04735 [Rariglobus hedericola]
MKYLTLLLLLPSFLLGAPRSESYSASDGSLVVSCFNDSGAPLRFTIICEGWSTDGDGSWNLDQSSIVGSGWFSAAQKGRKEKVGGQTIGKEAIEKMKEKYHKVTYKVVLEWSDKPISEWENPESVISYIRIK